MQRCVLGGIALSSLFVLQLLADLNSRSSPVAPTWAHLCWPESRSVHGSIHLCVIRRPHFARRATRSVIYFRCHTAQISERNCDQIIRLLIDSYRITSLNEMSKNSRKIIFKCKCKMIYFLPTVMVWMPMFPGQNWLKLWLGAVRQQAITWANVDQHLCHHIAH